MWTVLNQSNASIPISDIPIPQTLEPNESGKFLPRDVMSSLALQTNLANGSLVVTEMGSLAPSEGWLPVSFPVNNGEVLRDGQSPTFTTAMYREGTLYVNVTDLSGTLTLGYQQFDGTTYYPDTTLVTINATGPQTPIQISSLGFAGRVTWTLSSGGSATFDATLNVR
ncbi:MAG: hypothetical protein K6T83_03140 [Alicyclobacillus sp.]|nr:hypothetical protein [Alicyclobacillus sp.]